MNRTILVQPGAAGRISGGYLYNAQMAAHGAWDLMDAGIENLETRLDGLEHSLVLADSIWLTEDGIAPFLRLAGGGRSVGVMLHSFPSMIAKAEARQSPPDGPTAFELEALEQLGLAIVPGRHYADMLATRAIEVQVFVPGIDDEWRRAPRARGDRCMLVSVGAVTPRKGFLDVVEVLEDRARRDDYQWTVVGSLSSDVDYAGAVRERAQKLGTVVLAGQRSPGETRSIVQGADLLLLPSYDENQPLVLLEATAASVPSIAYAAGAASIMVEDGKAGFVVPIGDRTGLGARLERLLSDESERFRMAEHCWQRQQSIPSWEAAASHARQILCGRIG